MAIVVGHGGGFGNAGALIASAIGRDKDRANQRLMQMRELQNRGAIASAQAQMQYEASREANETALAKTAIQAGLQKDMQMAEYMQGLEQAKEQAKADAMRFDQKFTAEQRVKDAKLQSARKAIENSPDLSEEQRQEALRRLDVEIATNSNPTQVLGDPNNKPHPSGHEVGVPFKGDDGGTYAVEPDGSLRQLQSFKETAEGIAAAAEAKRTEQIDKLQADAETKRFEAEAQRQQKRTEARSKFVENMISANMKAEEGKKMSPDDIFKAASQYEDMMDRLERRGQKQSDPQQELIDAARENGGTVEFTTPSGEKRSYTFKGKEAKQRDVSNAQASESDTWLRNMSRQYGDGSGYIDIRKLSVEQRKQAQMHARRVKAAKAGR